MEAQCSSVRIPPCEQTPVWRHPKTGYIYCDEHWRTDSLRFEQIMGIPLNIPTLHIPTLHQRMIEVALGVPLAIYAIFFFTFWAVVGMIRIAVRRWRMLLPPQNFSYLDCHARGHQFGLSDNICEHCGAERFMTGTQKT